MKHCSVAPGSGALVIFAMLLAACGGGSTTPPAPTASTLDIVAGNGQSGVPGSKLPLPLTVRVRSASGTKLSGVTVSFAVTGGSGTVSPSSAVSDTAGLASTFLTLGGTAGTVTVTASVQGTNATAQFVETAGSASTSTACQTSSPTTLTSGQVIPGVTGTGICIAGATASADYVLIPFNASSDGTKSTTVSVTGRGVQPLSAPDLTPLLALAAAGSGPTLVGSSPSLGMTSSVNDRQSDFDARLRRIAREELRPLVPSARAWQERQRIAALRNAIPSNLQVGQLLSLNAQQIDPCANLSIRTGRVAAISSNAIVVADTANPKPTFTDAQYLSLATTFDTLVNPLDTQAFGQPTDIDKNGKILIFFTRAVNELTPRNSGGSFVGGFFFERDLFPVKDTTISGIQFQGCKGSNVGEMFYMLVPDTNKVVNDLGFGTGRIFNISVGTLAHEYQHLINAARRLYINTNADFPEEGWLNEGLSHIAEELLFYRVTGFAPRQNLNGARIGGSQDVFTAFSNFEDANFGRYIEFLERANKTSPYADNDSLQTRGATWSLLRYLADHRGASDADTWQLLVNSNAVGLPNLTGVFGSTLTTQMRDWATAVFTDDLNATTDSRFQMPSWNFRNIITGVPGYGMFFKSYPLATTALFDGTASSLQLFGGGEAYFRFTVPAGGQASVDWAGAGGAVASPLVQWTLVRTR
jgi:hypothetical protein